MSDLSDLLPLIQDKLNIIFTWDKYKESKCKSIFLFLINYNEITMSCCMENIVNKPADMDLCCSIKFISGFILFFKEFMYGYQQNKG